MPIDIFAPWRLAAELARIGLDSQTVIALRTAGMLGLWPTDQSEMGRMVAEKPRVAAQSVHAAARAAIGGAAPDAVLSAALRPIQRRTASNLRRLSKLKD